MKKIREILLLLVFFVVSFVLFFVVYLPSPFVAGSDTAFFGGVNYLRLLLNDKTFFIAITNTVYFFCDFNTTILFYIKE